MVCLQYTGLLVILEGGTHQCPGCPYGGLDLSRGLFGFLADLGLGVLTASWDFDNSGGSPAAVDLQEAYTPFTVYAAPTTTQWTPTSTDGPTSTYSSPTPFSDYASFSTYTMAFGSYSAVSGSSTSTTISATPSAMATQAKAAVFEQGTLNKINLAIIGLGALVGSANQV